MQPASRDAITDRPLLPDFNGPHRHKKKRGGVYVSEWKCSSRLGHVDWAKDGAQHWNGEENDFFSSTRNLAPRQGAWEAVRLRPSERTSDKFGQSPLFLLLLLYIPKVKSLWLTALYRASFKIKKSGGVLKFYGSKSPSGQNKGAFGRDPSDGPFRIFFLPMFQHSHRTQETFGAGYRALVCACLPWF
jgi:hypothetical protein